MADSNKINNGVGLLTTLVRDNISKTIIDSITDALLDKRLKPGDKIPTELEFSQMLGVGRNVVREAIKVLEAFGVVEIRRAEGTFIKTAGVQNTLNPMIYGRILSSNMPELIDFKISLLNTLFYMAITKGSDEELQEFYRKSLIFRSKMNSEEENIDECFAALEDMNDFLGQIGQNPIMMQMDKLAIKIMKYTRRLAIENSFKLNRRDELATSYILDAEVLMHRAKDEIPSRVERKLAIWRELLMVK